MMWSGRTTEMPLQTYEPSRRNSCDSRFAQRYQSLPRRGPGWAFASATWFA